MIKYNMNGNMDGETIIFINGAGIGYWMWDNQVKYLNEYKCITFDLPGHGENSDIDYTTIKDFSIQIIEIINKESKSKKAIIIGHSIGAQILMHMLEHHENAVSTAIIISGLNRPMPTVNLIMKPMVSFSMPLLKWKRFSKVQAKTLAIPDDKFEKYYADTLKISKKTFVNILYENSHFSLNKKNIKIPALILVGENEKGIMIKSAKKTKSILKNSDGYIVKEASHDIPYVQSMLLNNLILNFLKGNEFSNTKLQPIL